VIGTAELLKRFTYHPPHDDQVNRYQDIREHARAFAVLLDRHCPDSREKSLALTALEEAVMWANASIARNETGEPVLNGELS
jgi:hypothetical protein